MFYYVGARHKQIASLYEIKISNHHVRQSPPYTVSHGHKQQRDEVMEPSCGVLRMILYGGFYESIAHQPDLCLGMHLPSLPAFFQQELNYQSCISGPISERDISNETMDPFVPDSRYRYAVISFLLSTHLVSESSKATSDLTLYQSDKTSFICGFYSCDTPLTVTVQSSCSPFLSNSEIVVLTIRSNINSILSECTDAGVSSYDTLSN